MWFETHKQFGKDAIVTELAFDDLYASAYTLVDVVELAFLAILLLIHHPYALFCIQDACEW